MAGRACKVITRSGGTFRGMYRSAKLGRMLHWESLDGGKHIGVEVKSIAQLLRGRVHKRFAALTERELRRAARIKNAPHFRSRDAKAGVDFDRVGMSPGSAGGDYGR